MLKNIEDRTIQEKRRNCKTITDGMVNAQESVNHPTSNEENKLKHGFGK